MIIQEVQRLTAREIFDLTKTHLLEQQEKSWLGESEVRCGYRGKSTITPGKVVACAIGCRIPDNVYLEEFEEGTVYHLLSYHESELGWLPPTDYEAETGRTFLHALQNLHDRIDVSGWPQALDEFEKKWFSK